MWYFSLKRLPESQRARARDNLVALRAQLDQQIPAKDADDHLLLATWNIRDLAKTNRRGYGPRMRESHFYIAEVLSRFDFVAVQEVNELNEWEVIMDLLGSNWRFVATDVSDPGAGGNGERLTYLYDSRKVSFQNIAGEMVLPTDLLISENVTARDHDGGATTEVADQTVGRQFSRTPFTALFRAGWFKFDICTVHIYYGAESGSKLQRRIKEIGTIAKYFAKRAKSDFKDQRSLILLGDFNIVGPEHETMKALLSAGFMVPDGLKDKPSNIGGDKFYDQIVFQLRPGAPNGPGESGVFDIFKHVFTPEQAALYAGDAQSTPNGKAKSGQALVDYYMDWRTYQFSDHCPMWVRLRINDSAEYLRTFLPSPTP